MKRKLRAMRETIIVKPIEDPDIKNGIVILDRNKDLPQRGEVVAVGAEADFEVGDTAYFHKYEGGVPLRWEDELYLVIKEEKILGKEFVKRSAG